MLTPIDEEVLQWNLRFPIDRWWRNKHNIPYGSPAHRESNPLDQLFEFREDVLFARGESSYIPDIGAFMKKGVSGGVDVDKHVAKAVFEAFEDELEE
jgi:hypothetical protein